MEILQDEVSKPDKFIVQPLAGASTGFDQVAGDFKELQELDPIEGYILK